MSEMIVKHQIMTAPAYRDAAGRAGAKPRAQSATPKYERMLLPATCALVASAWLLSRYGGYRPGAGLGYGLGLAGGITLLVVFLYPLRKHSRWLASWGAMRGWFALHMACGIGAPFLILAHSTFHIGSINAGVALASMLLVAASGIVGRFIYIRVHHGLYGTKLTLTQLQSEAGTRAGEVRSRLGFAPRVEEWLKAFEAEALEPRKAAIRSIWAFLVLGTRARWTYRRCSNELLRVCRELTRSGIWDAPRYRRELAEARYLASAYLSGVQKVAQFSRYERLFSLWHVLHVPLVWMLILSAIAHVVAVHAY